MKLGTIALSRYFNGFATAEEAQQYQKILIDNFKEIGMFAFGQMQFIAKNGPDPDSDYDWKNIDCLVKFAEEHNLNVQYNTVINSHHNSFPDWYYALPQTERKKAIRRHTQAVIRRYKDRIKWFKLVNEARPYELNYLETGEKRSILIAEIFKWAKEEYPEGTFVLNDHIPFLKEDELREQYIKLIKETLIQGARIDVIGIEGHLGYKPLPFQLPSDEEIDITLDAIHKASNLPICITEFDLSYDNNPKNPYPGSKIDPVLSFKSQIGKFPNWFEYQAYAYKHFYEVLVKKKFVKGLTFWGFADKDWPDWERPGIGFFDENINSKPVYNVMKAILESNNGS